MNVLTVTCHTCDISAAGLGELDVARWLVTHRECARVTVFNETMFTVECSLLASDLAELEGIGL